MSNLLWKYYFEDDVDKFRRLLANAGHTSQHSSKGHGGAMGSALGSARSGGSPGGFGTSPKAYKNRKTSGPLGNISAMKNNYPVLGRAEVNSRDHAGLTILHRAVSSSGESATSFALALIEHPAIDLYIQDAESGWTALHRALYFGNIACARAIIERDSGEPSGPGAAAQRAGMSVIKVKDHESNSPFDLYNATIARRTLPHGMVSHDPDDGSQDDTDSSSDSAISTEGDSRMSVTGDEVYLWGTNKNYSMGFGDGDDRQHPEKIYLKRPDHLSFRFYREHLEATQAGQKAAYTLKNFPKSLSELPSLIQNRPLVIQDIALSKLHSAILTTDPESNLYMCGFGPGGRLGTGDEVTRFSYVCIEEGGLAGKKIASVALGRDHTLAVSSEGEIFSWGTNSSGQLGYTLPRPALKDEEPICVTPRQIFGPLKREIVIGVAASAIHSVAYTSSSLFTWGKNEGQLGLMDSDSRSLDVQNVPRRVAASLFKAPISMVSAINSATICLLANHTVCVFTNYGYNIVKFPLDEGFTNYHLKSAALTTRYDSVSNHISSITAGGDTIAAISSRGDLFTLNVRKVDSNPSSTSTTNPSKIKGALSQPQRIWALRKGHWDGVKSVGVTENGSVIVCTQAGAVWRRIKRAKVKDAYTGGVDYSRKDFKFQRVPGLTKVTAVRSTTFGVYAAIRKDCDVTKSQILIDDQRLWKDVAPLLSIRDVQPSDRVDKDGKKLKAISREVLPPMTSLKKAVLMSPDIEADVSRHLCNVHDGAYDSEVFTTTSDTGIPVHGFMLARSSVLRAALEEYRDEGSATITDLLEITSSQVSQPGSLFGSKSRIRTRIAFQGLDFFTIISLVVYLYTDNIIDLWHFSRQSPNMAFRYRQVRVELMKTAASLQLANLEASARLMTEPSCRLDVDLAAAVKCSEFFDDGDVLIELADDEILLHSAFLCQRCPFFEGLFKGRAQGQWLDGRRQNSFEPVRVDMKHIEYDIFRLVLRYLYSDAGTELFDDVVASDIDEFSEVVMDVMSSANELMLDRLAQVCQQVLGQFVTTRNVCVLLNAVAPFSVTEFKDSAVEYICLQLEAMLENHLLNDLDENLLSDLDRVVRANQLNCLPFAKSGRAERLLHEQYPFLAADIDEERQRRLRDMNFRANLKDDDNRVSTSSRACVGSLDDNLSSSPSHDKGRRKARAARNAPFSPSIQPKDSTVDLMFDMDDEHPRSPDSPKSPTFLPMLGEPSVTGSSTTPHLNLECGPRSVPQEEPIPSPSIAASDGLGVEASPLLTSTGTKTWSTPVLPSSKLDMREIMAQASSTRTSNLSISISSQKAKDEAASKASAMPKLSQKERKKQLQRQALLRPGDRPKTPTESANTIPSSPWQVASGSKTSLKDVLSEASSSPSIAPERTLRPPPASHTPRRTASPDTRFSGQQRHSSSPHLSSHQSSSSTKTPSNRQTSSSSTNPPHVPHSKLYTDSASRAEPSLQLSMADIIGQQRREQEVFKEAVAKRSLQEIQEEQAFQEWWDQESRRAQEEETDAQRIRERGQGGDTRGRGGRRGKGRGKGGDKTGERERGDDTGAGGKGKKRGGSGRGRGDAAAGASARKAPPSGKASDSAA